MVFEGKWARLILALMALEIGAVVAVGMAGRSSREDSDRVRASNRMLGEQLHLTDLALWSGASYCRHPSQADLFAPHGDHPSALDHFPAGSVVPPPSVAPTDTAHNLESDRP